MEGKKGGEGRIDGRTFVDSDADGGVGFKPLIVRGGGVRFVVGES